MNRLRISFRTTTLALCAVVMAACLAAPAADAKRHRPVRHPSAKSHPAALSVCRGAQDVPTAATVDAAAASTVCLVNRERVSRGLSPLAVNARLDQAAAAHSADMVANHYFEHTSPGGSTMLSRLLQSGYAQPGRRWQGGENIAWGTGVLATPDATVRAWMNSPGHRANILNAGFREVGTGVRAAVPLAGLILAGATYTQDFGARG